jgi:methylglutamate dehydrogenase subunit B
MRISCPYCGERGSDEFTYFGDAARVRPDPTSGNAMLQFADYVYLRGNPRGLHRELWYHGAGCRSWLVVTRNTLNHEISRVEFARDAERPHSFAREAE